MTASSIQSDKLRVGDADGSALVLTSLKQRSFATQEDDILSDSSSCKTLMKAVDSVKLAACQVTTHSMMASMRGREVCQRTSTGESFHPLPPSLSNFCSLRLQSCMEENKQLRSILTEFARLYSSFRCLTSDMDTAMKEILCASLPSPGSS